MIIEKNVPLSDTLNKGRKATYPFGKMEVGDSFRVPEEKSVTVRNSSFVYGSRNGKKFTVRKHEDAYRCWRIA